MKQVIIYGIRFYTHVIDRMLDPKQFKVMGYSDSNTQFFLGDDRTYFTIDQLSSLEYDYVLIGRYPFTDAYKCLVANGVAPEKIINAISFYNSYMPFNTLNLKKSVDIFATGLSYMYDLPIQLLSDNAVNLAYPGQDLLLDYSIAQYMIQAHSGHLPRYAIIGLAYYSFNYEFLHTEPRDEVHVKLARMSLWPGLVGRYVLLSRYAQEIQVNTLKQHKVPDIGEYIEHSEMFISPLEKPIHDEDMLKYKKIQPVQKKKLEAEQFHRVAEKVSNKSYPQSVKYNHIILKKYLQLLTDNQIKPIIVIQPQHPEYAHRFLTRMKDQFHSIIDDLSQSYTFQLIDCFESEIANDMDFKDPDHLDEESQNKFALYLRSAINWDE